VRNTYNILVGKLEGRRQLARLGKSGRIILKWILKKEGNRSWTGFI
jgi:hypothetical protein